VQPQQLQTSASNVSPSGVRTSNGTAHTVNVSSTLTPTPAADSAGRAWLSTRLVAV
jgi:hypothetical protein